MKKKRIRREWCENCKDKGACARKVYDLYLGRCEFYIKEDDKLKNLK